jgi:hypothetical protein
VFILSLDESLTPADGEALIASQQPHDSDSEQDSRNWSRLLSFLGVQTQPWNGWGFGLVELTGIGIPEGVLDIRNLTSGLRVDLNQQWLVATDQPAHIHDFVMAGRSCRFTLRALEESAPVGLAVGLLPPDTAITINAAGQQWPVVTDGSGVLQLAGLKSATINLTW